MQDKMAVGALERAKNYGSEIKSYFFLCGNRVKDNKTASSTGVCVPKCTVSISR